MSLIQNDQTVSITAPAPMPSAQAPGHLYTDIVNINFGSNTQYSGNIESLLSDKLQGCASVHLVKIEAIFQATAQDQEILMGMCDAGSGLTIDQIAFKPNAIAHMANARNVGERHTIELVPEDTLAKQIRPIASNLPMIKIMIKKDKSMRLSLVIYLRVDGMRQYHIALPSQTGASLK